MARLPEGLTAKQLGLKEGDKFRLVEDYDGYKIGTVVELYHDDDSSCPQFRVISGDKTGNLLGMYLKRCEPLRKPDEGHYYTIGEKVTIVSAFCSSLKPGETATITRNGPSPHFKNDVTGKTCFGHSKSIYLIDDAPISTEEHINNIGDTMADATTLLKEAALTTTDRVLRKHGLEDTTGAYTGAGQTLLIADLWSERREAIANKLTAAERKVAEDLEADKKAIAVDTAE